MRDLLVAGLAVFVLVGFAVVYFLVSFAHSLRHPERVRDESFEAKLGKLRASWRSTKQAIRGAFGRGGTL